MATIRSLAYSHNSAICFMNMGGPTTLCEVQPFLTRLFTDPDIIPLGPFQSTIGKWIARRRTPKIQASYSAIGGGSPIRHWSTVQAQSICKYLDKTTPETGPHVPYIMFRYASPLTNETMEQMLRDGVERAVAVTMYPQYTCSTTGSNLNDIYHWSKKLDPHGRIKWSVIDRWFNHPSLVKTFAEHIRDSLKTYADPEPVIILFSAHSLPMSQVRKGDTYVMEVASSVSSIMQDLGTKNPYRLTWQSKVGPASWMEPQTIDMLRGLAKSGKKNVLVVPIAFTSDHIETLFELDLEYGEEVKELGLSGYKRVESFNDDERFSQRLAGLVKDHLHSGEGCSQQMLLRC
ncbi:Ferrochelatase, mitochondrial, partial [Neolecta irregularis DAH-3]